MVQMFMDLSEDEDRGRRRGRRHGASPNEAADGNAVEHSGGVNSTPATAARPEPFYSWLQDCWPSLAFFVPQVLFLDLVGGGGDLHMRCASSWCMKMNFFPC